MSFIYLLTEHLDEHTKAALSVGERTRTGSEASGTGEHKQEAEGSKELVTRGDSSLTRETKPASVS